MPVDVSSMSSRIGDRSRWRRKQPFVWHCLVARPKPVEVQGALRCFPWEGVMAYRTYEYCTEAMTAIYWELKGNFETAMVRVASFDEYEAVIIAEKIANQEQLI